VNGCRQQRPAALHREIDRVNGPGPLRAFQERRPAAVNDNTGRAISLRPFFTKLLKELMHFGRLFEIGDKRFRREVVNLNHLRNSFMRRRKPIALGLGNDNRFLTACCRS